MKIKDLRYTIKDYGVNYGIPIIKIDVDENGKEVILEDLIKTLNENSFRHEFIIFNEEALKNKEELLYLINHLMYGIEINNRGNISPKGLSHLTQVKFCVTLTEESQPEIIKEYNALSKYKKAYYLFNIKNKSEMRKLLFLEENLKLDPIYLSYKKDFEDISYLRKFAIQQGWGLSVRTED